MASWSFRSTKASWLLRNLRPKRLEEPKASWSFRSTKASWLLSSLKQPMASWRFFCKRSTKASWLPEAETSRGAHGILDPKPFKAFNVRQTFSKNFQKLDPVLHALCGRCHCRWTSTHICTRIWGGQGLCPVAQEEPRLRAGASVRAFATTVASSAPYCLASSPASFPNSFGLSTRRMYTGFGNYTCLGTVGKLG